jgi:adenylate cyclase
VGSPITIIKPFVLKILLFISGALFVNGTKAQTFGYLKERWLHGDSDTARINAGLKLNKLFYQFDDSVNIQNKLLIQIYELSVKSKYTKGIIESSFRLADNYNFQFNTSKAIEYYYISLKKSELVNDWESIARAKTGIGLVYHTQNNWIKAIEFYKTSLANSNIRNDSRQSSIRYYLIGASLVSLCRFDEARWYLDTALKLKIMDKNLVGIDECKFAIADAFKGTKQYDSALVYYRKLLPKFIKMKELIPESFIYSSLAEIYLNKQEIYKAQKYADSAYYLAGLVPNPKPKLEASSILYKINQAIGDYKKAFFYLGLQNSLRDSMENRDFAAQLGVAQATYKFENEQAAIKAEQEKRELKYNAELKNKSRNQNILMAIALIALLFVIVIVFAYVWVSKQKKISEKLLLNILPKETADELKSFGRALPKLHEKVTIIFCDIKNFSHIAEKLSPEQLVEMLDTYFKQFDSIVEKLGLEKIKTIGDAYMCAAGLQNDKEDAAIHSVSAAIEILKFNDSIEQECLRKFGEAFYFRVGIHTGNVVSGVVGLNKFSYDIWGDAVNVAARMEQNSIPGMINISGATHELVQNDFEFEYRGKIPAKNKGEIDMYFVKNI